MLFIFHINDSTQTVSFCSGVITVSSLEDSDQTHGTRFAVTLDNSYFQILNYETNDHEISQRMRNYLKYILNRKTTRFLTDNLLLLYLPCRWCYDKCILMGVFLQEKVSFLFLRFVSCVVS